MVYVLRESSALRTFNYGHDKLIIIIVFIVTICTKSKILDMKFNIINKISFSTDGAALVAVMFYF